MGNLTRTILPKDLTQKQRDALYAVAFPGSQYARAWWDLARLRWQGPRRTLGSLLIHGLVSYDDQRIPKWAATVKGNEVAGHMEERA